MAVAIFVALAFNIQKSYWIVISAHTVMLGMTTVRMFDRAFARGVEQFLGLCYYPVFFISILIR